MAFWKLHPSSRDIFVDEDRGKYVLLIVKGVE